MVSEAYIILLLYPVLCFDTIYSTFIIINRKLLSNKTIPP